jgi:hypothetical protein
MQQRRWLRHYATGRKVAGSIPEVVIGFFSKLHNNSSRNITLEFAQHLTEMSTRNLCKDKAGQARKADNLIAVCEPIV